MKIAAEFKHFLSRRGVSAISRRRMAAACDGRFRPRITSLEPLEERAMLAVATDPDGKYVANVYADVLNRLATTGEITFWSDQLAAGLPRGHIVSGFLGSTEYRGIIVDEIYQDFLGRPVEQAGRDFWVDILGQGTSERELLGGILNSPEYFNLTGGTNADFIRGLYADVLMRQHPPGQFEVAFYDNLLNAGITQGGIALGFINSPEFLGNKVDEWFNDFLDRDIDPAGLDFYLDFFAAGGLEVDVRFALLASEEYAQLTQRQLLPGTLLALRGRGIDPTAQLSARFSDDVNFSIDIPVATADMDIAQVVVPPLFDTGSGDFTAGTVNVQLIQDGVPLSSAIIASADVAEAPEAAGATGAVTEAFLGGAILAINDILSGLTGTSFDTTDVRAALTEQRNNATQLLTQTQAIIADPAQSFNLGTIDGSSVTLGATELAVLDRLALTALEPLRQRVVTSLAVPSAHPTGSLTAQSTGVCFDDLAALPLDSPTDAALQLIYHGPEIVDCLAESDEYLVEVALAGFGVAFVTTLLGLTLPASSLILIGSGLVLISYSQALQLSQTPEELREQQKLVDQAVGYAKSAIDNVISRTTGFINAIPQNLQAAFDAYQAAGPPAEILVTPTTLSTSEALRDQTFFEVRLTKKPTDTVSINLGHTRTDEGTLSTNILVFTPSNWFLPQQVRVTGVDEFIDDGDQNYTITLPTPVTNDPNYQAIDPDDVTVTNTDNDQAGVIVTPTGGLITDENGRFATFTVRLTSQPMFPVTLFVSSDNRDEGLVVAVNGQASVDPGDVTFTSANWHIPQVVAIQGQADSVVDADQVYHIVTTSTGSADTAYQNLVVPDVMVTNQNTDVLLPPASPTGLWVGTTTEVDSGCEYFGAISLSLSPLTGLPGNWTGTIALDLDLTADHIGFCSPKRTGVSDVTAVLDSPSEMRFFIPGVFFSGAGIINGNQYTGTLRIISGGVVTTGDFSMTKVA